MIAFATVWQAVQVLLHDPQQRHAALVHLPIAVSVLGVPLVAVALVTRGRSAPARWAALLVYAAGIGAAVWAMDAGGDAAERVEALPLAPPAKALLHDHAEMGEDVWIALTIPAVALVLSGLRWRWVRILMLAVAMLGAVGAAGWVAVTAHYGGTLVYVHGVGVPRGPNNLHQAPTTVP